VSEREKQVTGVCLCVRQDDGCVCERDRVCVRERQGERGDQHRNSERREITIIAMVDVCGWVTVPDCRAFKAGCSALGDSPGPNPVQFSPGPNPDLAQGVCSAAL
jgi:hypothetical protein